MSGAKRNKSGHAISPWGGKSCCHHQLKEPEGSITRGDIDRKGVIIPRICSVRGIEYFLCCEASH